MINTELYFYYAITFFPIMMAVLLFQIISEKYFDIKADEFDLKTDRMMFEIQTPKEILKTPLAMELVLAALHSTSGESTWFDRHFLGKRRVKLSLEIVSTEGNIKFYIWSPRKFKKVIESAFYSQYPSVQLVEVLDYTKFHKFDVEKNKMFGVEYKLAKPNPYPIKTYKDFGLDKSGVESEEIVDPMSSILEIMGNIGKGENMWMQIVIKAQKKDHTPQSMSIFDILKKRELTKKIDWKSEAEEIIDDLRNVKEDREAGVKRIDSDVEKKVIDAIAENISKPSFWTGIRSIYYCEKGEFDADNIKALTSIFNVVKTENLNNLNAGGFTTSFDYPWNDYKDKRMNKIKSGVFDDYKKRKYFDRSNTEKTINPHFFLPFLDKMTKYNDFILSTEELATIFHLPTTATATPTFERAESKRAPAPSNLPF